jgi:hypothetical protein
MIFRYCLFGPVTYHRFCILSERDEQVRRAAADLVYRMFQGLGILIFDVVPQHIRQLQQSMELLRNDTDEATAFLANLAVDTLHEIVQERVSEATLTGNSFFDSLRFVKRPL